jgi:hypothetical protein
MTPKEKAEELLKKMNVIHYFKLGGKQKESNLPVSMHDDQVKQCALIAVDEILRISIDTSEQYSYYLKVKQEIELL